MATDDPGFLRRWSRRKASARADVPAVGQTPAASAPLAPAAGAQPSPGLVDAPLTTAPDGPGVSAADASPATPALGAAPVARLTDAGPDGSDTAVPAPAALPSLADVARLTPQSDFSRFVGRNVGADVRNAAMRKLFSDPSFNVMDGLDIYIDDYSKPEPLPAALARRLASANFMGLFDQDPASREPPTAIGTERAPRDGSASLPMDCGRADGDRADADQAQADGAADDPAADEQAAADPAADGQSAADQAAGGQAHGDPADDERTPPSPTVAAAPVASLPAGSAAPDAPGAADRSAGPNDPRTLPDRFARPTRPS